MADDEIERLLREVSATTGSSAGANVPATQPSSTPARVEGTSTGGGRLAFAGIAAVGMGGAVFVFALLTPFTDNFWTATGAAMGAFFTGLVAGPPRWFSS
jgi:hypothetical protein